MPFEQRIFEFSKFRKCVFWFEILSSAHNGLIIRKNSTFLFTRLNWHLILTESLVTQFMWYILLVRIF